MYTPLFRAWLRPSGLQPADLDDLTQDALRVVARKLATFRHNGRPGAFRAWLREIVRNTLRGYTRSGRRSSPGPGVVLAELADPGSELNRRWDEEHDRYVLRALMNLVRLEFADTTWAAFHRTAVDGLVAAAVAAESGVTVNAVHIARSRVLARLRREAGDFLENV